MEKNNNVNAALKDNPFALHSKKKKVFDLEQISNHHKAKGKLAPPTSSSFSLNLDDFIGVGDIVEKSGKCGVVVDASFVYSEISKSILINKIRVSWADDCWAGIDPFETSKFGIELIHKSAQRLARLSRV